jgi:hypothetical protein
VVHEEDVAVQLCSSPLSGGPRVVSFGDLQLLHVEVEPERMVSPATSGVLGRVASRPAALAGGSRNLGLVRRVEPAPGCPSYLVTSPPEQSTHASQVTLEATAWDTPGRSSGKIVDLLDELKSTDGGWWLI